MKKFLPLVLLLCCFITTATIFAYENKTPDSINTIVTKENISKFSEDVRPKYRIGFDAPQINHRQLLLTIDENCTDGVDWGYEGETPLVLADDMYWLINNKEYVIQGIDTVFIGKEISLGVITTNGGAITIKIDALENPISTLKVGLKDTALNVIHKLEEGDYQVTLDAGVYHDRFFIVFLNSDENAVPPPPPGFTDTDDTSETDTTETDQTSDTDTTGTDDTTETDTTETDETSDTDTTDTDETSETDTTETDKTSETDRTDTDETSETDTTDTDETSETDTTDSTETDKTSETDTTGTDDTTETDTDTTETDTKGTDETENDDNTEYSNNSNHDDRRGNNYTRNNNNGYNKNKLVIYVNNGQGILNVKNNNGVNIQRVALLNRNGQKVKVWNKNLNSSTIQFHLQVKRGVYLVLVKTDKGRIVKRVLIQNS